jgi:branched-chain amino acid transport system permease protein
VAWFQNYNPSGIITAPPREMFGVMVTGPTATAEVRYLVALSIVVVMAMIAKNVVRLDGYEPVAEDYQVSQAS